MKKFLTDRNIKKRVFLVRYFANISSGIDIGIEEGKQMFRMNNFEIYKTSRIFLKPEVQKD